MESRDVILRPIITEASMNEMDNKRYTFEVDLRANKTQVKDAVEDIFEVEVAKVNIFFNSSCIYSGDQKIQTNL